MRTRALFSDLLGLPKGKYVPKSYADGGRIGFARGAFGTTFDRDLIPVPHCGVHHGLPDMELAIEETRPSWQEGTEIALGDLHADGPFALCPRTALKRAVAAWRDRGLTPMVGIELEAFVFEKADGVWRPYDTPGAFVYGTGPMNEPAGLTDAIWETADRVGLPVESVNGEYDNGQFELTLGFADALRACDDAFLFKAMAREVAWSKGYLLTFLPRPIPDRGGSGMHVNFSLSGEDGNAIGPEGRLSPLASHCIAGLMAHHEGLSGLLAPTVNSYERLRPASMAGYWANWAEDHRLVTTRTAVASPRTARLEHRMADGSANPYLAVAAVLQAARLGVEDGMDPPPPEDLDGLENVRATRHVPPSLDRALAALDADEPLRRAVGTEICDAHLFLKRDEFERLQGRSTDEARDFYLPFI